MPVPSTWPVIDSGTFRHRISILRKVYTKSDESGEDQYTLASVYGTLWAAYALEKGQEREEKDTTHGVQFVKFTTWFVSGIDSTMVVRWNGSDYDITSVDDLLGVNHFMAITCRKVD